MHKTVSASIGNALFTVEESAYASLDAYLRAIRSHFAATADADEIVADIEDRIAEEFSEALGAKRKVILQKDVDAVIARMGTVEDFRTFDGAPAAPAPAASPRRLRLYRDADDQIIGGVCSGIAQYFNIDPIVVRLAFLASLLVGGFGVVLYIALWVLLPEARTTTEKVEMTGGRVTLSAIQDRIDAVMPPEKRNGAIARVIRFPFAAIGAVLRGIGRLLKLLLPIAGRLLGVGALLWASFAMAATTFVFLALLTNPGSPYVGFPLLETVGFGTYVALLLSGYFAVFLPLLAVLLLGVSLMLLRNVVTFPAGGAIFSAWLLAIVAGGVVLFGAAPKLDTAMEEFDRQTSVADDASGFDRVRADGIDRFDITHGTGFSVTIRGSEKGVALADAVVENGTLVLRGLPEGDDDCLFLCPSRHVHVDITMPALAAVEAADASRVSLAGFSGATLELTARDVGRIDGKVSAETLTAKAMDAARISLSGTAAQFTASTNGVARVEALDFTVQHASVSAVDASRIAVDAQLSLEGEARDVARIDYVTPPPTFEVETSDAARTRSGDAGNRYDHGRYGD